MNRDCGYYRKQRMRAVHRKEKFSVSLGVKSASPCGCAVPLDGLSNGKCWMCRRKSYDAPQIRDKQVAMDAAQ